MVVAQVIDSLEVGGAESMAVSLANSISASPNCICLLIVGRRAGPLEKQVDKRVRLFFLRKKYRLDPAAILRLRNIIIKHQVAVVHAHSTSFLLPLFLRISGGPKLIWHDHHGGVLPPNGKHPYMKRIFLEQFNHVFCASEKLCKINRSLLQAPVPAIEWLPNFSNAAVGPGTIDLNSKPHAILHLANFRRQKDHFTFLKALGILMEAGVALPPVTLAGFAYEADYLEEIRQAIINLNLAHLVIIVVDEQDVAPLLQQANIGMVSSASEGLPISLIEYGLFGLAVVTTDVGEIPHLVHSDNGWICAAGDPQAMAKALQEAIEEPEKRRARAIAFNQLIDQQFNPERIVKHVINTYSQLLQPA